MIIIDCETTGVDPKISSMVSLGAVDFHNPSNIFYQECRIWQGAEVDQEALDVNGFTSEQVTDPQKQSVEQLAKNFLDWISSVKDHTMSGHNVWFDMGFLRDSIERAKIKGYELRTRFASRNIDLHSETYTNHLKRGIPIPLKNNRTNITSDYAFQYVGLPSEPKPHLALTGAKMEAEALSRLIYGKNLLPEFEKYPIPSFLNQ